MDKPTLNAVAAVLKDERKTTDQKIADLVKQQTAWDTDKAKNFTTALDEAIKSVRIEVMLSAETDEGKIKDHHALLLEEIDAIRGELVQSSTSLLDAVSRTLSTSFEAAQAERERSDNRKKTERIKRDIRVISSGKYFLEHTPAVTTGKGGDYLETALFGEGSAEEHICSNQNRDCPSGSKDSANVLLVV